MQHLKQEEGYSLSSDDLKRLCPGARICTYQSLRGVKNVNELLNNRQQACFILVPIASATQGHWELLFRAPDGLHFFDPVGCSVDTARLFAPKNVQKQVHDSQPLLAPLLQRSGENVKASTHDFQVCAPGVCTCGRHCVVRLWHRDLTDAQYAQWLGNFADKDAEVTRLVEDVLHK